MDIYFLRHASAGQHDPNPAKDEKRPLDKSGIQQSHDMGRALAAFDLDLDAIISSPLTRALQTAEIVAGELDYKEKIITHDALRPDAKYQQFQEFLRERKDGNIMVVGHNPSLTEFLNKLLTRGAGSRILELKKGAVAKVEAGNGAPAELKWCIPPKLVRSIQQASAKSDRRKTDLK